MTGPRPPAGDPPPLADPPSLAGPPSPAGPPSLGDIAERWPVLASAELASSHIVTLRADQVLMPDGTTVERDVVVHPGAVGVVALDDDDRILMIRQYRHPVGRLLWEIPAGLRDQQGEPPHRTAERELLEETGFRAGVWHVLADYFSSPGIITERLRIFLARGLTEVAEAERRFVRRDEEAQIRLAWMPIEGALTQVLAGELHNGPAVVGILSAYAARRDGFAGLRPADAPER